MPPAFPDAFRDLTVEPLAPFFTALSDSLYRLAPVGAEAPVAVLLTPGPQRDVHRALVPRAAPRLPARRGAGPHRPRRRRHLKTLRGLRRVHAILRRLDDDFCDPVELRADSALGIPGLLHVIRSRSRVGFISTPPAFGVPSRPTARWPPARNAKAQFASPTRPAR
ncbi:MAG: circularly permuted type 2 ATP-grasp protein [Polyangiaceae bacterium]